MISILIKKQQQRQTKYSRVSSVIKRTPHDGDNEVAKVKHLKYVCVTECFTIGFSMRV